MLKDRRALLEHDLKAAHDQAAQMYLDIVRKTILGLTYRDPSFDALGTGILGRYKNSF
jgi:hypothetical protein